MRLIHLSLNDQWHVTGGVRYNYTEVDNTDRRADQSGGSLTEKQSWGRINPTIGVTFKPNERYSTYASYSESNRAPTSIEWVVLIRRLHAHFPHKWQTIHR
jgi:outer membrane receptor protein involved in Fe transport